MTCTENWTSCNGFALLFLALLAIAFNLTPLVADYVEDGRLFHSPISCYEWWLPGVVGGGLLVLPAVSMSFAAKKKGSCNSRGGGEKFPPLRLPALCEISHYTSYTCRADCLLLPAVPALLLMIMLMPMLASSLLSVVAVIGGAYCTVIGIYAISKGPLICEKGSKSLDQCDYTLGNLSNFQSLKFDLEWFLNETCMPTSSDVNITGRGMIQERLPDIELGIEINESTQKIIHITVFVALAIIGLLEALAAISQIAAGLFGFLCGTSKYDDDYD